MEDYQKHGVASTRGQVSRFAHISGACRDGGGTRHAGRPAGLEIFSARVAPTVNRTVKKI